MGVNSNEPPASDNVLSFEEFKAREFVPTPEATPIEEINAYSVVLRLLHQQSRDGCMRLTVNELVSILHAFDGAYDALTGLCTKARVNKRDLNAMFEAFHSPFITDERTPHDPAC